MNKLKLKKLVSKSYVQRGLTALVALVVVGSVAYLGSHAHQASQAATGATLSLSPATGNYVVGSTLTFDVMVDSGTDAINGVQASLTYNPSLLGSPVITEGTVFPFKAATNTSTPGTIRLARSLVQGATPVSGVNKVITISFTVLTTGTASVDFDRAYSIVTRSSDSADILASATGGTYTLRAPAPTISGVTPASGPIAGGTSITITGSRFVDGATVQVGGTYASSVTVASATSITATVPVHTAGTVDVVVTNPDGQSAAKAAAFSYVSAAPTITSVTPASGPTTGGSIVTIAGTNFIAGATVKFGTSNATGVSVVSGSSVTAVVPLGAQGAVPVTVTNPDGQSAAKSSAYTYTLPGDANNDGRINQIDYSLWFNADSRADFNGDGAVTSADLSVIISNWTF